jgi:sulfhydrogenase subunit gamma (sulfur reductase)
MMSNQPMVLTIDQIAQEANQLKLLRCRTANSWTFIPGQVGVLGIEGVGESYFAIASAPEDKEFLEFLVKDGKGAAAAIYQLQKGATLTAKGPVGKGFPIDNYKGRDFIIAAVGSAIAPMRSVLRSMMSRRNDFGKVTAIFGARYPADFPFIKEVETWKAAKINAILTSSRPEGTNWTGKSGHVNAHFAEALKGLNNPVALICGMKAMMEESRNDLLNLKIAANEILTNY